MATQRQLLGLSQSAASGRVFAKFSFNPFELDGLVRDLNYASTQGVIQSVTHLKEIGDRVLEEVKRKFPKRKSQMEVIRSSQGYRAIRQRSSNLVKGWRIRYYDAAIGEGGKFATSGASILGFYIEHKLQNSARVRTILNSLETGSKPYTIYPINGKALRFPNRKGTDQQFAMKADIPARPGFNYLAHAEAFADRLLASRGSQMEKELVDLIERAESLKLRELSRKSLSQTPTDDIGASLAAFPDNFAGLKSPLAALRKRKAKVMRRR